MGRCVTSSKKGWYRRFPKGLTVSASFGIGGQNKETFLMKDQPSLATYGAFNSFLEKLEASPIGIGHLVMEVKGSSQGPDRSSLLSSAIDQKVAHFSLEENTPVRHMITLIWEKADRMGESLQRVLAAATSTQEGSGNPHTIFFAPYGEGMQEFSIEKGLSLEPLTVALAAFQTKLVESSKVGHLMMIEHLPEELKE